MDTRLGPQPCLYYVSNGYLIQNVLKTQKEFHKMLFQSIFKIVFRSALLYKAA
jgi:hypothetical protein